jgi:tRNA(fMet)-specific endonuclease VapC
MNAYRHVKLFKNGRNQAVRIPREFELPGENAIMRRAGAVLARFACRAPSYRREVPRDRRSPTGIGRPLTRFLLDTNILSDLVRNPQGRVAARIAEVGDDAICTSIIVAAELRFGAAKRGLERLTRQVESILSVIDIQPFGPPADETYAQVRAQLEAAGSPIGGNDMLIAAHARASDCIMVTDNEREFSKISRLKVENWLR